MDSQLFAPIRSYVLNIESPAARWHQLRTHLLDPAIEPLLVGQEDVVIDYLGPHLQEIPAEYRVMPWKVLQKLTGLNQSFLSPGESVVMRLSRHVKFETSVDSDAIATLLQNFSKLKLQIEILDLTEVTLPEEFYLSFLEEEGVSFFKDGSLSNLTHLKLKDDRVPPSALKCLPGPTLFKNLIHLELMCCDEGLKHLAAASHTSLAQLETLVLHNTQLTPAFVRDATFLQLTELRAPVSLTGDFQISFPSSTFSPQLKTLFATIGFCTPDTLRTVFSSENMTSLTKLVLTSSYDGFATPACFRALADSLPSGLEALGFNLGRHLTGNCLAEFSKGKEFPSLQKLALPWAGLSGDDNATHIRSFLRSGKFPALTSLDLSHNGLSKAAIDTIFSAPELKKLTSLAVDNFQADSSSIDLLSEEPTFETLHTLSLSNSMLTVSPDTTMHAPPTFSLDSLTNFLSSPLVSQLKTLKLTENTLESAPFVALSQKVVREDESIVRRLSLEQLDLQATSLGDHGLKALGVVLDPETITALNLSCNYFSAEGIRAFFEGTPFRNLRSLSIAKCGLDDLAIEAFVKYAELGALEELTLSHNKIGSKGAELLAKAPQLRTVTTLSLRKNQIGNTGLTQLLLHSELRSLTALFVSFNDIDKGIATTFGASHSLFQLERFKCDQANPVGFLAFEALLKNPAYASLCSLDLQNTTLSHDEIEKLHDLNKSIPSLMVRNYATGIDEY